jgi:CheY-like chemotaxis protein
VNRPTVLVVEDEPAVLGMARLILERAGYIVLAAETGPDALARYRESADRVAVVVLDLNIPGLSGLEVLAALRRDRPDLRVIVSTGSGCDDFPSGDFLDIPTAVLSKPYRPADLANIVNRVLAGR